MITSKKTKEDILKSIGELLDCDDCCVRIQREMTSEQKNAKDTNTYVFGKRVTIIVVGTSK